MDGFGTPHTKQLHVIERFHLIEDGKVLEANVHVEDPGAFTMPWNATQRFRQYEAAVRKIPIERIAQLASAPEGPLVEHDLRRQSELLLSGYGRPAHTAGGRARFLMALMVLTTLPHWTIGAALTLFSTAVAAAADGRRRPTTQVRL